MPHPHGPACQCPTPTADDGLLAYTVDCEHYQQLANLCQTIVVQQKPVTLRVLTREPHPPSNLIQLPTIKPCDGTLTCPCDNCQADRSRRARQRSHTIRQPWQTRPARQHAA